MKNMDFLEQLLDGQKVEWKKLGEVCNVLRGRRLTKKDMIEDGEYLVYQNSMIPLGRYNKYNVKGGTTYVICAGSAGEIGYSSEDFWAADDVSYFECPEFVHSKFLYYYLLTQQQRILRQVRKAGVPRLAPDVLRQLLIPLPSLSVQSRIVEILDKFTSLEAELEAELDCRKRQYIYYRELLLDFSDENKGYKVEWKKLGEVCDLVTDFTAAGSFASNAKNVKYLSSPDFALMVRTTDLKQKFQKPENFVYVNEKAYDYLWRVKLDKDSIILPNVGNCGEVYFITPTMLPWENCVLGPNALLVRSSSANQKFLYYLFHSKDFQEKLLKITSPVGQTKFNKTNLKQLEIPIPPLSEQARIVEILDKFDTLTNSITEGLPLEIKLRRQQYEYYREQLLDFRR